MNPVHVIGAGLAGSECAYQLATRGVPVTLHEMRPARPTPAHRTGRFAELVCSNSLRSDDPLHAAGLLKREMEALGSLTIGAARRSAVPAGGALAVDRDAFAAAITATLEAHPLVTVRREEVHEPPPDADSVLATGPLTSDGLASWLRATLGEDSLYFYDSIAPIVEGDSLDLDRLFWASRYGKGEGDDYLNAPMNRQEYEVFHAAILGAEVLPLRDFEAGLFFEGCLPIEEMARRGLDTLRFGPMKPVGLRGPDGRRPWAVVQLRQENLAKTQFNLVGFQSRMRWPEQERVFRMIPGLESAVFARLGQVHRNTFVNAPRHLDAAYRLKANPRVRLAGQITGVEGYLESSATGLVVALYLAHERSGRGAQAPLLPPTTALGALARHLTESDPKHFQPANINYGLFPELEGRQRKDSRRAAHAERARAGLVEWAARCGVPLDPAPLRASAATA
jgi:methylenetetrahydrofolate--tRNA-(uracil-5-)-methyltransferase